MMRKYEEGETLEDRFNKVLQIETETDATIVMANALSDYVVKTEAVFPKGVLDSKRSIRVDILVFKDDKPLCVVEMKRDSNKRNPRSGKLQQIRYGKVLGLPVFICRGIKDVSKTLGKIEQLH